MKTKSVVQERLEASKNRLEVVTREVESNRMPAAEVSRALRQIGTYLESIQKLVQTDTNVKFAQPINQKLEAAMTGLSTSIRGLDSTQITGNQLQDNLTKVARLFDSIQEFVDLEIEDLA